MGLRPILFMHYFGHDLSYEIWIVCDPGSHGSQLSATLIEDTYMYISMEKVKRDKKTYLKRTASYLVLHDKVLQSLLDKKVIFSVLQETA